MTASATRPLSPPKSKPRHDAVTRMPIRFPMPAILRLPRKTVGQRAARRLADARDVNRRGLIRGAASLGALGLLTGCDVSEEPPGAIVAAHGVGVERRRAGDDIPAATIWRRHSRRRRWSSRRALTPITISRTSSRSTAPPGNLELVGRIDNKHAVDRAADLPVAGAGDHHPAHLRRRLGLHRTMVRAELARFSPPRRRRPDRQIRLFHLCRQLYRKHRHGVGAASADHPRHQICRRHHHRSVRLIRCGCAPRPSSATRTRNGSRRSRSPTIFARRSGASRALTGLPEFTRRNACV